MPGLRISRALSVIQRTRHSNVPERGHARVTIQGQRPGVPEWLPERLRPPVLDLGPRA
ncbi:hypothetical protein GCM10020216_019060 [Nonomuraea helvata]